MASRLMRRMRAARNADGGFTLIEATVALMVLSIVTAAVAGLLITSFKTTRDNKARVSASNLAARELEITREAFGGSADAIERLTDPTNHTWTNPDPLDPSTPGQPLVVNGIPFTVVLDMAPLPAGTNHSACDAAGTSAEHPSYLATVTVTWPNMGLTQPVKSQTVLTPNKDFVLKANLKTSGYLAVKVTNAHSVGTVGVPIKVTGTGGPYPATTDATGCAVVEIPQSAIGAPPASATFTVTANEAGYVDQSGRPQPTISGVVTVGQITVVPLTYDQAVTVDTTFAPPSGYNLPLTQPMLTFGNQLIQPAGTLTVASNPAGGSTSTAGLWPFTSGYSVWAGSCEDADPAASPNAGSRPTATIVTPGQTGSTTVTLAGIAVTALASDGVTPVAAHVVAHKAGSTAGCQAADQTLDLGFTDPSTGQLATSLPYGNWQISATDAGNNTVLSDEFSATSTPGTVEVDFS